MSKIQQTKAVLFSVYNVTEDYIDPIFGVRVSRSSAETLVRRDGIANHLSIEYCLSNISAKNYQNWLRCVELIVCNISVVFLRHSVHASQNIK